MKEKLLNLLCCPACRGDLILDRVDERDKEVKKGSLKCPHCQIEYPIVNYIPRFVKTDKYVGNFSFEWTVHKRTQLDSDNKTSESLDTFIEKTGVKPAELKNKVVLDAGCGTGRYMEVVADYVEDIIGFDLSYAVETAQENLEKKKNVHIVQADIFHLPFKKQIFDFVYSIGVLHHTPNTRKAFEQLIPLVINKGILSIWVYTNEGRYAQIRNKFSDFYRRFTVHLPTKWLWYLSHLAIPLYTIKKVKKLRTILDLVLPMSNHPNKNWRVLDTFDWYSPKYQWKHTYYEVDQWFEEAGFENIQNLTFPVAVKGEKINK